jgi:hypothetical protein
MSDRYIFSGPRLEGLIYECDEEGHPVKRLGFASYDVLEELNRLARLVDDTANLVRRTEHTVVRNVILAENLRPEELVELPIERPEGPWFFDTGVHVSLGYYNKLLRTIRTIWEKTA